MQRKFTDIKNDILGKDYSLSIAYVDKKKSRELNKKYRKKDKATNVLSFALRKDTGELVLCEDVIKKEAKEKKFVSLVGSNFPRLLVYLVIHGMLHLKGMQHSSTMDEAEEFYYTKYDKKYFSGNRRRLIHDKGRGRRISKGTRKS
jgi:probable rRNA maturation factor